MPDIYARRSTLTQPTKLDAREEAFSRAMARGLGRREAAKAAFVGERAAALMSGQPRVKARIAELRQTAPTHEPKRSA